MATAIVQLNRVEMAATRYRDGFLRDPLAATELEDTMVLRLMDGEAWAFREWTQRALEAGVLSEAEVDTVGGARKTDSGTRRPTWR